MKSFIINSNDAGQRVSKFIEKTVPALPQGLLYKSFRLKRIKPVSYTHLDVYKRQI